nr:unnamed protein product [Callosobruchus chinensis]
MMRESHFYTEQKHGIADEMNGVVKQVDGDPPCLFLDSKLLSNPDMYLPSLPPPPSWPTVSKFWLKAYQLTIVRGGHRRSVDVFVFFIVFVVRRQSAGGGESYASDL